MQHRMTLTADAVMLDMSRFYEVGAVRHGADAVLATGGAARRCAGDDTPRNGGAAVVELAVRYARHAVASLASVGLAIVRN